MAYSHVRVFLLDESDDDPIFEFGEDESYMTIEDVESEVENAFSVPLVKGTLKTPSGKVVRIEKDEKFQIGYMAAHDQPGFLFAHAYFKNDTINWDWQEGLLLCNVALVGANGVYPLFDEERAGYTSYEEMFVDACQTVRKLGGHDHDYKLLADTITGAHLQFKYDSTIQDHLPWRKLDDDEHDDDARTQRAGVADQWPVDQEIAQVPPPL